MAPPPRPLHFLQGVLLFPKSKQASSQPWTKAPLFHVLSPGALLPLVRVSHHTAVWTSTSTWLGPHRWPPPHPQLPTHHCLWLRVDTAITPLCSPGPDPRPLPVHQDSDHSCPREPSWMSRALSPGCGKSATTIYPGTCSTLWYRSYAGRGMSKQRTTPGFTGLSHNPSGVSTDQNLARCLQIIPSAHPQLSARSSDLCPPLSFPLSSSLWAGLPAGHFLSPRM